jgi:hypothetical protein
VESTKPRRPVCFEIKVFRFLTLKNNPVGKFAGGGGQVRPEQLKRKFETRSKALWVFGFAGILAAQLSTRLLSAKRNSGILSLPVGHSVSLGIRLWAFRFLSFPPSLFHVQGGGKGGGMTLRFRPIMITL